MPTPVRSRVAAAVPLAALALPARARPGWAGNPDTADAKGHSFVCEGAGKTEDDAIAAAHAICNDKICKLCGVEVVSTTETKETLSGVDFQRKVVERCHRVRRAETQVKRKSSDCEEFSCTSWIEVFYPVEVQQQECQSYTKEDFADPAACEQDLEAFRRLEGRTADSFRRRAALLDAALVHCAKIDVRPTPAMLALDEKLRAGLDAFEFTEKHQDRWASSNPVTDSWSTGTGDSREAALQSRPYWAWYLATDPQLRQQIAESKTLLGRFQLARDYVASRALVFDVIEAVRAGGWDSPAGIAKLAAAMERAPTGTPYGRTNVHFAAVGSLYHVKSDTAPIGAVLRKLYDPASLQGSQSWTAALFFADDKQVTPEEWDWTFKAHQQQTCLPCLRVLLGAPDHGPDPELRYRRFLQAYADSVPRLHGASPETRAVTELTGYGDPGLMIAMEQRLPAPARAAYTWKFFEEELHRLHPEKQDPAVVSAFLRRAVVQLAADTRTGDKGDCTFLGAKVEMLASRKAELAPLDATVCACLTGPLRTESHLANRDELLDHANGRKLACAGKVVRTP